MALTNVFTPNGFSVIKRRDGAAWTAAATEYKIAFDNTHKFYKGDPVIRLSTGYVDVNVTQPTQGVLGIFIGCKYLSTALGRTVWSPTFQGADTTQDVTAYVIDDPAVTLRVWVGNDAATAGGPAVFADIGQTIDYEYGTGNAQSGISGAYVSYDDIGTTNTLPFVITGVVTTPPGMNGTSLTTAGNLIEVAFNQQAFQVGQTGL